MTRQRCVRCGTTYPLQEVVYGCRRCGELLEIQLDLSTLDGSTLRQRWGERRLGVWRYQELLPVEDCSTPVTLAEGGTHLQAVQRLQEFVQLPNFYVKNEGQNPTGSFKDRGMTVVMTVAQVRGARLVVCASTGNTAASLAAYAARAGVAAAVIVPAGGVAVGKLRQALAYGAKVVQVAGGFDAALHAVREFAEAEPRAYLLNSINPFRLEGQKTCAFEIVEQLGRVPDIVAVPVGNAGNISALWKGFVELTELGVIPHRPRMVGVQAEGAAPIAHAFQRGKDEIEAVPDPRTVASALRIGAPVSWRKALDAVRASGGTMVTVTDAEILEAQSMLARLEGLFVEPAGAASTAGVRKLRAEGWLEASATVVAVATGHGLKDPDVVTERMPEPPLVGEDFEPVRQFLTPLVAAR